MKTGRFAALLWVVLLCGHSRPAGAQSFSGILDTRISLGAGAGDAPDFLYGFEEYANIRMQAKLKELGTFYGAFNFLAASGTYAVAGASAQISGENYLAAIELERLYFRLSGEKIGLDAGLMRLPFGYGQVWGSSDFLNPRSPLASAARPRAILGAAASIYPADSAKLQAFSASPKYPFAMDGSGLVFGLSAENHWDRASVQALYAYETPVPATEEPAQESYAPFPSPLGLHRWGLSVKADLILGFVADALYAWNPDGAAGIKGLSAGAGFDYSFLNGDCYVLAEYLYSGGESSTATGLFALHQQHYLYALFRYRFNDFASASLSCAAALEDRSFSPTLGVDYEIAQGVALNVSATVPLDRALLAGGDPGELGAERTGSKLMVAAVARLRF